MTSSSLSGPASDTSSGPLKAGALGGLLAVALGAASFGFAVFVYVVPYRKAVRDLKMARGELLAAKAEAAGHERELILLRGDLSNAQQAAGDAVANVRSQTNIMRLAMQEQAKSAPAGAIDLRLEARGLQLTFASEYLFAGGGAQLSEGGVAALKTLGRSIGRSASRVIVTAPLGKTRVPPELAKDFPSSDALSAERVRVVVKALDQAGVGTNLLWGVSTGGPAGDKDATVGIEITPSN
ncbi:MAG: hypothetical protein SF187_14390 [Deltaproteobacteria bacterium]|nr:hypothetical protein [Deltaproteobacteria bacterium]